VGPGGLGAKGSKVIVGSSNPFCWVKSRELKRAAQHYICHIVEMRQREEDMLLFPQVSSVKKIVLPSDRCSRIFLIKL